MKVQINRLQYFCFIPNVLFGKAIGLTAGVIVRKVGADVWQSMLIGFLFGMFAILLTVYLGSKFPEKSILQYSRELVGKWGAVIIGIVLSIFFAFAFITSANTMTLHISEYLLPNTPFLAICMLYTLLCLYGVILGIEVTMRLSFIAFLMTLLLNVLIILGTIRDFEIENLLPLMDKGVIPNLSSSFFNEFRA